MTSRSNYDGNYNNLGNSYNGFNDTAEDNFNVLTTLLASEVLKPHAAKARIELDEDMKSLCRAALVILKQDKAAFENAGLKAAELKTMSLGTIASRLAHGQSEYAVESEDMIESRLEGGGGRERALPQMQNNHRSFNKALRGLKYSVDALERGVKAGSWSVLDAEKALRCIAELAEPDIRDAAEKLMSASNDSGYRLEKAAADNTAELRKNAESILVKLAKKGNELIKNDMYAVSRRLVLASFKGDVLGEMDGELAENVITGRSEELSIMSTMKFNVDTETGIRYLAPSSLFRFAEQFTSRTIEKDNEMTTGVKVNLSAANEAVLEAALAASQPITPLQKHTDTLKNTELFLYSLIRRVGEVMPPVNAAEAAARQKEYADFEANIERSPGAARRWLKGKLEKDFKREDWIEKFFDSESGLMTEKDISFTSLPGYKALHVQYMTLYRVIMQLKAFCNSASIYAGFREGDSKEGRNNTPEFAFDASIPLTLKDPSKPMQILLEAENTVLRIDALPVGYINPASIKGREMIEKLADIRWQAVMQVAKAKKDLTEGVLTLEPEEVAVSFRETLIGKRMKPTEFGWFSSEEMRDLFVNSVKSAIGAMTGIKNEDPDSTITSAVMQKLDEALQSQVNDKRQGRVVHKAVGADGEEYNVITPPDIDKLTNAARFRVITNYPCTFKNDTSIRKEDGYVWYDDTNETERENYIIKLKDSLLQPITSLTFKKAEDGTNTGNGKGKARSKVVDAEFRKAEEAFNKIMEIFTALKDAGGRHLTCVQIIDDAFEKAKELYIKNYLERLDVLKTAVSILDALNLDGTFKKAASGNAIMQNYMVTGKMYGEMQICGLAAETLARLGHTEEAQAVIDFSTATGENGKWEKYKNLSSLAKEELSRLSLAITESSLESIEAEAGYYEMKNSEDSFWYGKARGKSDTSYNALAKGTIPYFTEAVLAEKLREQVFDIDAAETLAAAYAGSKAGKLEIHKAFKAYAAAYKAAFELEKVETSKNPEAVDVEKGIKNIATLKSLIAIYKGKEEEKVRIESLMRDITDNNPLLVERMAAVREKFEHEEDGCSNFREWKAELMKDIQDMKYLSPLVKANLDNRIKGSKWRVETEKKYIKEMYRGIILRKEELASKLNILSAEQMKTAGQEAGEDIEMLSAENHALLDVAHVRLISGRDKLLDNVMRVIPSDMIQHLGSDLVSARTAMKAHLRLLDEAIDADVYTMAGMAARGSFYVTGKVGQPGPFITGKLDSFIRLPLDGGTFAVSDIETIKSLEREGFAQQDARSINMREERFNKAIRVNTEKKGDMFKPFLSPYRGEDPARAAARMKKWGLVSSYKKFYPEAIKEEWKEEFRGSDEERYDYMKEMSDYTALRQESRRILNAITAEKAGEREQGVAAFLSTASRFGRALRGQGIKSSNVLMYEYRKKEELEESIGSDNRG